MSQPPRKRNGEKWRGKWRGKIIPYLLGFGSGLARFHQSHVHRYPHFANVGLLRSDNRPDKVIIRDLDCSIRLADLTPPQRFFYFLLDLSEVHNRCFLLFKKGWEGKDFGQLFPAFLEGYLSEALAPIDLLLFVQRMAFLLVQETKTIDSGQEFRLAPFIADLFPLWKSPIMQRLSKLSGFNPFPPVDVGGD